MKLLESTLQTSLRWSPVGVDGTDGLAGIAGVSDIGGMRTGCCEPSASLRWRKADEVSDVFQSKVFQVEA